MAKPAWHMTADPTADQRPPEQRHRQARCKMDKGTYPDMEKHRQPFAPMPPVPVVEPFQQQERAAGGNGAVMPECQLGKGDLEDAAAEKDPGNADMAGTDENGEPAHPSGGATDVPARGVPILLYRLFRLAHLLSGVEGLVFSIILAGPMIKHLLGAIDSGRQ